MKLPADGPPMLGMAQLQCMKLPKPMYGQVDAPVTGFSWHVSAWESVAT